MRERRRFTARQRLQIVLEGLQSDASVAEVCRRYEISTTLYYRWRDQLYENAERIFGPPDVRGERRVHALEAEAQRLKDVIAEITAENLDLKKTPGASKTMPPFRRNFGR